MQIVTDLNYLARELAKEGKEEARTILLKVFYQKMNLVNKIQLFFQDASRLHLISSPKQRPIDFIPDLRSRPIWSMEDLKPASRWSSASSLTGLGLATTHLAKLEEQFQVVAKEATLLAERLDWRTAPGWMKAGR